MTPDAVRFLAAKGLSALDIAELMEMMAPAAPVRSANAERQARYRENKKAKTDKALGIPATKAAPVTRNVTRNVTPPNDIYSNPPVTPSTKVDCPPDLAKRVVEHWNDTAKRTGLTAARALDNSRRQALRLRVKEHGEQAAFDAINRLGASEWHTGKNENGWKATIGWFLKPTNFLKALEMPDPPDSQPARQWSDAERLEYLKSLETA